MVNVVKFTSPMNPMGICDILYDRYMIYDDNIDNGFQKEMLVY